MNGHPVHQMVSAKRGELVISGAVACHRIWIVIEGLVALATVLPDGRRQITDLCTPGDVICPICAMPGTECWVEALGSSVMCQVSLMDVMKCHGNTPDLMTVLFKQSHAQLERSNRNQVMLGRYSGKERVFQFVVEITRRIGTPCKGGFRVHLPMNRDDIADYLGLNAATVIRLFSALRKTKLVTFISPTEFIVHDPDALEDHLPNALRRSHGNAVSQI